LPGCEKITEQEIFMNRKDYQNWGPEKEVVEKLFFGFGKQCASVGKVLAPFGFDQQGDDHYWIPNPNHASSTSNQTSIVSDECVTFGSSGGCVVGIGKCKHYDVNGITLVEFSAIHFSGEFISCSECLKIHTCVGEDGKMPTCGKCLKDPSNIFQFVV